MNRLLVVVQCVTTRKEDIRQSIKNPKIDWLFSTSAGEQCAAFLAARNADTDDIDEQRKRYEAGELLLILAAMEGENEYDTLEALRLMGTRNVDARGEKKHTERYRLAGEARKRPVTDPRHYVRHGHLGRTQQRLASELHVLIIRPDRLQVALETSGATAIAKYL